MKETTEFLDSLFNTITQGFKSFKDGVQITDLGDFIDEGLSWPKAIEGLSKGFSEEALLATSEEIELLFEGQKNKLIDAGVDPILTGAILSAFKSIYYTYAAVAKEKQTNKNSQV